MPCLPAVPTPLLTVTQLSDLPGPDFPEELTWTCTAWSCVPLLLLFALAMGEPPWLFPFLEQAKLVPDFKLFKNIYIFFSFFFSSSFIPPILSSTSTSFQTFILAVSSTWTILSSGFHQTGYFLPFWFHLNIRVSKRPLEYHHPSLTPSLSTRPPPTPSSLYHRGQQTYSAKGQIMNISDFAGRPLSLPLHSAFVL